MHTDVMCRKLFPLAALLLLASCMTAGLPNYGRVGCIRAGRDKAHEIGMKAGAATANTPATPTVADLGVTLLAGTASAVAQANGVNVGFVLIRRFEPVELCRASGMARGIDPICRYEPLAKP